MSTDGFGFPTPDSLPEDTACRVFSIPNSPQWLGVFMGAMLALIDPAQWYEFGELTPEECAEIALDVVWASYEPNAQICPADIPAPFWDDSEDVDDSLPVDGETWYGEVTNPTAPPDELTFVEDVAIWTFTGFVAYAAGIGAAIAYRTIAPRFVLAWKRGDLGEIIRVVIDAADYAEVDTSTVSEGEIITLNVLPDPDAEYHDIMLVKVG
jgi:hypothetical protein